MAHLLSNVLKVYELTTVTSLVASHDLLSPPAPILPPLPPPLANHYPRTLIQRLAIDGNPAQNCCRGRRCWSLWRDNPLENATSFKVHDERAEGRSQISNLVIRDLTSKTQPTITTIDGHDS